MESELQVVLSIATLVVVFEPVAVFVWAWRRLRRGRDSPMAAVGRYALATALGPAGFLFGLLALNAGLRSLGLPSWSGHESAGLLLWFLILVAYVACTDFVFAAAVAIRLNADERRAGQQGG